MADFSIHRLPPSRPVQSNDALAASQSSHKPQQSSDRVEISSEAMALYEAERLLQVVRESPDIRQEKVERIMAAIEAEGDAYFDRISNEQLAEAMLSNPFSDFFSPNPQT